LGRKRKLSGERNPGELDFENFISIKIFDRNSDVRFHKSKVEIGLQKPAVRELLHGSSYNQSLDPTAVGARRGSAVA